MKDNYQLVTELYVIPSDQVAFESLGFHFEPIREFLKVTFPVGWTMKDIDNDAFTCDLIDENGRSKGKIEFGCYPNRKGNMWLF